MDERNSDEGGRFLFYSTPANKHFYETVLAYIIIERNFTFLSFKYVIINNNELNDN